MFIMADGLTIIDIFERYVFLSSLNVYFKFYVAFLCLRRHKTYVNRRQIANKMFMYVYMVVLLDLKSAFDM